MRVEELGRLDYRSVWKLQEQAHGEVLAGGKERLLLVEHAPVITFGRRPGVSRNLIASQEHLKKLGVEVVESDRGGDITFHGPGQLVAYPIVRLADHKLSVSGYVHTLERVIIETLGEFGIEGRTDASAVGVWVGESKMAAIGVRIRRGVTMHGLALNVTTDLSFFNLIVPCGLAGRGVTSLQQMLGEATPSMRHVKDVLVRQFRTMFSARSA